MLTDGGVGDPDKVVNAIKENCSAGGERARMFTFGVGSGCSRDLVIRSAKAGAGSYSFAENTDLMSLREKTISALQRAAEPALIGCSFSFMQEPKAAKDKLALIDPSRKLELGQLFRNDLIREFTIMTEEQFTKELACTFECEYEPRIKGPSRQTFDRESFVDIGSSFGINQVAGEGKPDDADAHLFKLAAKRIINDRGEYFYDNAESIRDLSVKYQVLSRHTSFIGVVKQKGKVDAEMQRMVMPTISAEVVFADADLSLDNVQFKCDMASVSDKQKIETIFESAGFDPVNAIYQHSLLLQEACGSAEFPDDEMGVEVFCEDLTPA